MAYKKCKHPLDGVLIYSRVTHPSQPPPHPHPSILHFVRSLIPNYSLVLPLWRHVGLVVDVFEPSLYAMDQNPSWGSSNIPSRFMRQKPVLSAGTDRPLGSLADFTLHFYPFTINSCFTSITFVNTEQSPGDTSAILPSLTLLLCLFILSSLSSGPVLLSSHSDL